MLQHVLIAVDGSPPSRKAARFGLGIAQQTGAKATLISVLEPPQVIPVGPLSGYLVTAPAPTEAEMHAVKTLLDELAAEWPMVATERVVELGAIADTIVEQAEKRHADLIVMGARGLGAARRILLGSVSDRVVHHAHCPVTVFR